MRWILSSFIKRYSSNDICINHIWIHYFPPFTLSQMLGGKDKNKWFDIISNKTETGHGCQGKWQPQRRYTLLCSPLQSLWFIPSNHSWLHTRQLSHLGLFWQAGLSTDWDFPFCMTIMSYVYKSTGPAPVCSVWASCVLLGVITQKRNHLSLI